MTLPARPRILVVALRRLGDVLLTTPLIRSLQARLAGGATIDVLVFAGTEGILDGNPDHRRVITMPERPSIARESCAPAPALAALRSCGLHPERRPADLFAWAAGRRQRRLRRRADGAMARRRSGWLLERSGCGRGAAQHRVSEVLRLAEALGVCAARPRSSRRGRPAALPASRRIALCGDPCGADVPLQAMDRRRLARARGRARRARARGRRDRRSRGDRRYLDEVWAGSRKFVGSRRCPGRSLPRCIAGARSMSGPTRR